MALTFAAKEQIVNEVNGVAQGALSLITAEYQGISANEMTSLRQGARDAGVYLRVVRNTLAKRALEDTPFSCTQDNLKGPIVLAFSQEDPAAAARLFKKYLKENEKISVTGIALSGQLLAADQLNAIASLPTREQALGMLAGVMQAPLSKLARTLAETYTQLARTIAAVRDQKQAAG